MGDYKVKVSRDKCIGAASCVAVTPKAFKMDDEQKAVILDSVNEETNEKLVLSAQSCPTAAIEITDKDGKRVWPKT